MKPRTKGGPPVKLTGKMPISSTESPWWDSVASKLISTPGVIGHTISIEELTQMLPSYPDGRRPRPRTVSRRLRHILELVKRGPNGSRGNGATYRIIPQDVPPISPVDDDGSMVPTDEEWLQQSIDRMTANSCGNVVE